MINLKRPENIQVLVNEAFKTATEKGWHETPREFGTCIALMHSEVDEAYEAILPGGQDNFAEEMADILIRIYDACGEFNIPLHKAVTTSVSGYTDKIKLLMDIHYHLSQALESFRQVDSVYMWNAVAAQFSAVCCLIVDNCEVIEPMLQKMEKNKNRPYRHGGKRA
jgi:NTP pyrophosphatase (non-canonical NTP hydrolase)